MMWVAWRQHRTVYLMLGGVLAAASIFLLIIDLKVTHAFQQLGLATCKDTCASAEEAFQDQYGIFASLPLWANVWPVLLGLFVGVPVVSSDLEQGTHRLLWAQSITRLRWLLEKLALALGVGLLSAGILMALLIWGYGPFEQVGGLGPFSPLLFDVAGPVWLASVVLTLALGVFAGTLTRHTVAAMLLALALFLAIRVPVEFLLRPQYLPAITETAPLNQEGLPQSFAVSNDDWIIAKGLVDAHGNRTTNLGCVGTQAFITPQQCFLANGYRGSYITFQPADRFWPFQWIETGIDLAFVVLALGAAIWLVKHQLH
jgi:hypothetical protein